MCGAEQTYTVAVGSSKKIDISRDLRFFPSARGDAFDRRAGLGISIHEDSLVATKR
jgi:hypothetical protein